VDGRWRGVGYGAVPVQVREGVIWEVCVRDERLVVLRVLDSLTLSHEWRTRCSDSLGPPRATRAINRRFLGADRTCVLVDILLFRISCRMVRHNPEKGLEDVPPVPVFEPIPALR
jgi:hypothetical protein